MEILRVSSASSPNAVAGALASIIKRNKNVEIQAIGAAAVNQVIKAVAITRGFVAPTGRDLVIVPSFMNITIGANQKTGIKFLVKYLD